MIVENQKVKVKWHYSNEKHFLDLGYLKETNDVEIDIKHLFPNSKVLVETICDNCKCTFLQRYNVVNKSGNHFCTRDCYKTYITINGSPNKTSKIINCENCNKDFEIKKYRYEDYVIGKTKFITCSRKCQNEYLSKINTGENSPLYTKVKSACEFCGKTYSVAKHRENKTKYCSDGCRRNSTKNKITTNCGCCNKELQVIPSRLKDSVSGKVFCSNKCVGKFNGLVRENKINKTCSICNIEYQVIPSLAPKSVTCSVECQKKWQSLFLVGKNANNYNKDVTIEERTHNCDWCGNSTKLTPYQLKLKEIKGKKYFCSKNCYREWYAKDWSQQEEWKQDCQERAVKMLNNGTFGRTDTEPQLKVNQILDKLLIKYVNEYNCKSVAIDNYLPDYNLMIEVNGTYWHCDPRVYKSIEYQMQYDRIIHDRRKVANILSNYGVSILYLWEKDIMENPLLCEKLILLYINNNGKLDDYNSFNYKLMNDELIYTKTIQSYMNYDLGELHKIFVPVNKEKKSYKQLDKWITFNCDNCGKETEQLISRYRKNKTHCCSVECNNKLPRNRNKQ